MISKQSLHGIGASSRVVTNFISHKVRTCFTTCPDAPTFQSQKFYLKRTPSRLITSQTGWIRDHRIRYRSRSTFLRGSLVVNQQKSMATRQSLTSDKSGAGEYTQQSFDYFLVLDFEATCDDRQKLSPQEIIEFPVLKINAKTGQIDSVFHQYISPQFHPQLTPFCTELTGIIQDMVTDQPHLPDVLQSFNQWMLQERLLEPECHSIFVTCGDWDLKTMLPNQCAVLGLAPEFYFNKWINIKKSFADVTGTFPKGMMYMLQALNLKHEGRHHSGIDDCHNIANILVKLMNLRYVFKENGGKR